MTTHWAGGVGPEDAAARAPGPAPASTDDLGVRSLTTVPRAAASHRPVLILLTARPVRDRTPSATQWQLTEYDPTTGLPVDDIAARWEPATHAAIPGRRPLTARVLAWLADTLGRSAEVGEPADSLAGPGSWYVHRRPPAHVESPAPVASSGQRPGRQTGQEAPSTP